MTPEQEAEIIRQRQDACRHAMLLTQCAHCGITRANKEKQDAEKAAYALAASFYGLVP